MKNIIQQILSLKCKTQSQLSCEVGLNAGYLNRIISGKIVPTVPTAHRIAKALGLRIEDVFLFMDDKQEG